MLRILVAFTYLLQIMFVFSPNFLFADRVGLIDDKDDWLEYKFPIPINDMSSNEMTLRSGNESTCMEDDFPRKDITSASYIPDDNYLNGTIWLESSFQKTPNNLLKGVSYTMSIVELSKLPNPMYSIADYWNPGRGWLRTVYEHSLSNASRVIESPNKFVGFGNSTDIPAQGSKSYVNFHLDIRKFPLPDNFLVVFTVAEFSNKCFIYDFTDTISSAQKLLNVSTSPKIELRPGEQETVQLVLESLSLELENVTLAAKNGTEISLGFLNNTVDFDSSGKAFAESIIKVTPNANPREYLVPFLVNVTLPETIVYPILFTDIRAAKTQPLTNEFTYYVKVNVLKPYSDIEKLNNFLQENAGILSFIAIALSGMSVFYSILRRGKN